MGEDFLGFLSNLVQVFPSLAKRPLYLTGEVKFSPNCKILIDIDGYVELCRYSVCFLIIHIFSNNIGTYIPYIAKTYFGTPNPPVNLVKFAIGGLYID